MLGNGCLRGGRASISECRGEGEAEGGVKN